MTDQTLFGKEIGKYKSSSTGQSDAIQLHPRIKGEALDGLSDLEREVLIGISNSTYKGILHSIVCDIHDYDHIRSNEEAIKRSVRKDGIMKLFYDAVSRNCDGTFEFNGLTFDLRSVEFINTGAPLPLEFQESPFLRCLTETMSNLAFKERLVVYANYFSGANHGGGSDHKIHVGEAIGISPKYFKDDSNDISRYLLHFIKKAVVQARLGENSNKLAEEIERASGIVERKYGHDENTYGLALDALQTVKREGGIDVEETARILTDYIAKELSKFGTDLRTSGFLMSLLEREQSPHFDREKKSLKRRFKEIITDGTDPDVEYLRRILSE